MTQNTDSRDYRSLMQSALLELRGLRARLKALETAQTEPIAVVGMGCRFPGGVDSPESFWQLLCQGMDAITEVPPDRWNVADYYDPDPDVPGKIYTRYGGFVDQLHGFDATFFGIADREAMSIDPQQRLLLEVSWEALENAGIVPEPDTKAGGKTGVFVGISSNDYSQQLLTRDSTKIDAYLATGNSHSTAAGRLSYTLGFTGPSLAIDTACSSSLVAVHLACQSLRSQECHLALVGGVNRIISPEFSINFAKAKMLSADGRCKTFDATADGFVRAEGCGMIVLKRLSDAVADGNPILAVIRGSAVNQDGRSGGLTVPNGPSQQAVIRQALENSRLQPEQISYVEAHGTGTALGDPIEVNAIGAILGQSRTTPLWIGSVKTNLGHLEAAAGIAGLIKVILSLYHQEIPAHLHFRQPNPHIAWQELPLVVPTQHYAWQSDDQPRRAGVSSFGFSGTNAHVIVEEAAAPTRESAVYPDRPLHLLILSAKTPAALKALVTRYQQYLTTHPDLVWADVCYSASTRRAHFSERLGLVAGSSEEAAEKLAALVTNINAANPENADRDGQLVTGSIHRTQHKLAILFTASDVLDSQGYEKSWLLYQTQPIVRQAIDQCAELLQSHLDIPLLNLLYPGIEQSKEQECTPFDHRNHLNVSHTIQLALFAVEYALAQLLFAWDIQPDIVVGQGIGTYVAACIAGVFSLEDAFKLLIAQFNLTIDQVAQSVQYSPPKLPVFDRSGQLAGNIATAAYWCQQQDLSLIEETDLYKHLDDCDIILSITATSSRISSIDKNSEQSAFVFAPNWQVILTTLAHLYTQGVPINWRNIDRDSQRQQVNLPTYPFQHRRYWIDRIDRSPVSQLIQNRHPLLGHRLNLARSQSVYFENQISQEQPAFLKQHRVFKAVILPASGYIEMALAAGRQLFPSGPLVLTQLSIHQSIELSKAKTIQLILTPDAESQSESRFEILSQNQNHSDWNVNAIGSIHQLDTAPMPVVDVQAYKNQCQREINLEQYYAAFQAHGIDYGVDFRALQSLCQGEGQALGQIQLPTVLLGDSYELHPVLLDAAFQVIGAALNLSDVTETYLPIGCDRLTLHRSSGDRGWSHAKLRSTLNSQQQTVDLIFTDLNGAVIATVEGLQLRKVAAFRDQVSGDRAEFLDWLYQIEWKPQPLPVQTTREYLPPPETLRDRLLPDLIQTLAQPEWGTYRAMLEKLEDLSFGYVLNGLAKLNWQPAIGQRYSTDELAQRLDVAEQHQSLLHRLLEILAEEGILHVSSQQWQVIQMPPVIDCSMLLASLHTAYPFATTELTLLDRCGSQLASVLQGKTNPLQLLFPDGDSSTAQLYRNSVGAKLMNQTVQQILQAALEQKPTTQTIRVLEIGAGTGGTTAYLLPLFNQHINQYPDQNQVEYLFTDVSPLFLSQAKQQRQNYSFVEYQILDIERSPASQNLALHQYDVVIAANVIHATQNLQQSFQHIHQLLAPGGLLILLEGIRPLRWLDLIFGLTEGWWRFRDRDLRPNYPLLSADQWQQVMQATGFEAVNITPGSLPQAVFVARTSANLYPDDAADVILIDRQGIGQQLAAALQGQGRTVIQVFCEPTDLLSEQINEQTSEQNFSLNPTSLTDTQQLLDTLTPLYTKLRVIHLWSLDLPDVDAIDDPLNVALPAQLSLLNWIQANTDIPVSLYVITKGAISTQGEPLPGILQTPIWGLGKVINLEHPEYHCQCIDLDTNVSIAIQVDQLLAELRSESKEDQIIFRNQERYVARLKLLDNSQPSERSLPDQQPFQLVSHARGTLENLTFQPTTHRSPHPHEVEIRVWATGVNFIDVLDALGLLPFERDGFGVECAGEIVAVGEAIDSFQMGDRVVALAPDSYSQYVTIPAVLVAPLPAHLSFEAAATLPANFLTAHYALRQMAQIKAGDRVLIHAAAGGTGMAAVQIAQQVGAEVFATASPAKWEVLHDLGVRHVMNSRTLDFAKQVMELTQGEGVDVVLNALSGDFIPKSLSVLNHNGQFLEIGKRDAWTNAQVNAFKPGITYHLIDLLSLTQQQPMLIQLMLRDLMMQFEAGLLHPLPHKVFPIQQIISAFRYMQQAKHIGKIVVSQVYKRNNLFLIQPDSMYLITGGCGGLGLLTAEWLVQQGATHLVLIGRHAPSVAANQKIQQFQQAGVHMTIAQADVADRSQLSRIIEALDRPLRGVIHAAGVLDDGLLEHMDEQRLRTVMAPKIAGAWHLHQLTQNQPLDFFVLFSSAASLLGSPGQANHVAANGFLDALAHHRQAIGQPGLSINWGAWSEVGSAVNRVAQMQARGVEPIVPEQGIQILERLMQQTAAQVGVIPIDWKCFQQQGLTSTFFEAFRVSAQAVSRSPLQQLAHGDNPLETLVAYLQSEAGKVLGLPPGQVPKPQQGFFDLGMDSLMTVELKNRLEANLGVALSSTILFEHPTIRDLAQYLVQDLAQDTVQSIGSDRPKNETKAELDRELATFMDEQVNISIEVELTELESLLKRY